MQMKPITSFFAAAPWVVSVKVVALVGLSIALLSAVV